jgi:hypothetical protein
MAKTIPQLTDATTVNAADELIVQQGGITKRATANEFLNGGGTVTSAGSTTGRTLQARFGDVANVRDFGAVSGGNATTNAAAFQAAINSGKPVYVPSGFYPVDSELLVTTANTVIFGDGSGASQVSATHAGNVLVFQPTGAGSVNEFLNNCALENIRITRTGTFNSAVGATVWVRQCNAFTARDVVANNGNECFRVTGGQLNSFIGCSAFVSNSTIQKTTYSGCWVLEEANLGGGNYQPCYTITVTDFRASTTKLLNHIFLIRSVDGFNLSDGYCASAASSLFRTERQRTATAVGAIQVSNVYFDCTDPFGGGITGTPSAITIGSFGLGAGQYGAAGVSIANCTIANNDDTGSFNALIDIAKYCISFNVSNCYIANSGPPYAVEIFDQDEAAAKGSYSFVGNHFYNVSNASSGGAMYLKDVSQTSIVGNQFEFVSSANWAILFDGTIDSTAVIGNTCDDTPDDFVVFANGMTINDNAIVLNAGLPNSGKHVVRLSLPTSDTSLPSGSMWNDSGTVKIKA